MVANEIDVLTEVKDVFVKLDHGERNESFPNFLRQ
jgi:hypothetical protein